jgi:hypothetical protein
LSLLAVTPAQAGAYDLIVTNIVGSVTSLVAQLTVLVPPAITTQPVDQEVEAGETATFTVVATGSEPLSYLWSFEGAPLAGATATAPSLVLTEVSEAQAGNYTVTVTNKVGSIVSNPAKLTVREAEPPTLTVSRLADGRVLITWDGDSLLQTVETLDGDWLDLSETTSPYRIPPADVHRFYRLRRR